MIRNLLFALLLSAVPAFAETLVGKVVGVTDGDTLTLLTPEVRQVKIRLADIDTPESHQPYGTQAKKALSDLVFGESVSVEVTTIDRYGRSIGRVTANGTDVNAELVRSGAAWVYRKYSHDPALLLLESQARDARLGLWSLPEADQMPPWEWRAARRH